MPCICCGSTRNMEDRQVLWKALIDEWRLATHEVAYMDRQQCHFCTACGSNFRSRALAKAIMTCYGFDGLFVDFCRSQVASHLKILEINTAGSLTRFLQAIAGHRLVQYPQADMLALPFEDAVFDLVLHSDTLEHVPRPVRGLTECRRVLKPGGYCAFTVPMIVDRLTTSREGLPPSYHGSAKNPEDCLVHTEYGADAWKHVALAGFSECRVVVHEYPAALALVGVK